MEPTISPGFMTLAAPAAAVEATMERAHAGIAIHGAVMSLATAVPRSRAGDTTREPESEQSRCKEATHC
jgi:hypothetical protein